MLFDHLRTHPPFTNEDRTDSDERKKKLAELFRTDLITAMKVPESDTLDLKKCLVITDPWRNEWNRGVQVPVRTIDGLPKPRFRELDKEDNSEFKLCASSSTPLPLYPLRFQPEETHSLDQGRQLRCRLLPAERAEGGRGEHLSV